MIKNRNKECYLTMIKNEKIKKFPVLETERLIFIPLNENHLKWLNEDRKQMEESPGLIVTDCELEEENILP